MKRSINKFSIVLNLKKEKKGNKIKYTNDSNKKGFLICPYPIYIKNKKCKITSDIEVEGSGCQIKLINRKLRVVENISPNFTTYLDEINKLFFIGISVKPHTTITFTDINIDSEYDKEREILEKCKSDILLLCPEYPSDENKYRCSFIHSRIQAYKKNGINVDLAVVNGSYINKTIFGKFEDVNLIQTGYNDIRKVLQIKKYKKILIHFFDEKYAQILDATNLEETELILYSHGSDTLYRAWDQLNAPYFTENVKIPKEVKAKFAEKDSLIKRYNEKENVKFVFVSNWAKEYSERLIGIKYKNCEVIPCNIDLNTFKYHKKNKEQRKKICIIRKFDNLRTYSIDISTKIILELSKKDYFKDLEFNIYGDGDYHQELLEPIKDFDNVHIHKKFLSHKEMAEVYKESGIALFPTRFDTQGVAACEAAAVGTIVVTSKNVGTEEYISTKIGTYCDVENINEYVKLIENIYNNENLFTRLSEEMYNGILKTLSDKQTIKKDIQMITTKNKIYQKKYKKQADKPLFTIAIPSYNVGKFIENGVHSLIDVKNSHKLEVLIISDGSKDNTVELGKKLEKLTTVEGKSIVKIIDKENGGHGSTINKGIELARGKYFKLMDGDDYFIKDQFEKLIDILEKEDSDIILTNYISDYSIDAIKEPVRHYEFMKPGKKYKLDMMTSDDDGFGKWGPLLSTSTYKTEVLKKANFLIDEHCFYVDMEYNFIGYLNAQTIVYYPLDVYNYYLGRAGQSVSPESYKRNFKQHERVIFRLLEEYEKIRDDKKISYNKKTYLRNRILIPLIEAQYYILTQTLKSSKEFRKFDSKLKEYKEEYNDPVIARIAIKIYRATNAICLPFITDIIAFKNKLLRNKFK